MNYNQNLITKHMEEKYKEFKSRQNLDFSNYVEKSVLIDQDINQSLFSESSQKLENQFKNQNTTAPNHIGRVNP